ncbi:pentapeptide repeat-containing protein [Paenibacillus sp. sgz500958]|uniref:pentapeptide repeat-containing protein n=1 Tax=Paenibacillus sp. sgz500958 TaxID=3242475 RepID=UPI0036D33785
MSDTHNYKVPTSPENFNHLKADCTECFGLCCAALPFSESIDFAINKEAGQPCPHLQTNFRCGQHQELRELGFRGCTVYDCFGAGQKVSRYTYDGVDWLTAPDKAKEMFEVFPVMRQLHELLWYLNEALIHTAAYSLQKELQSALEHTQQLTLQQPETLLSLDVNAHRAEVNKLLLRTSELVRNEAETISTPAADRRKSYSRGADLIGAKLKRADLRGANLRGAFLIAADLREADLRMADLIGADFRDADIRGADLRGSIFLTQFQVNAAIGDSNTQLPPLLEYPSHWQQN